MLIKLPVYKLRQFLIFYLEILLIKVSLFIFFYITVIQIIAFRDFKFDLIPSKLLRNV